MNQAIKTILSVVLALCILLTLVACRSDEKKPTSTAESSEESASTAESSEESASTAESSEESASTAESSEENTSTAESSEQPSEEPSQETSIPMIDPSKDYSEWGYYGFEALLPAPLPFSGETKWLSCINKRGEYEIKNETALDRYENVGEFVRQLEDYALSLEQYGYVAEYTSFEAGQYILVNSEKGRLVWISGKAEGVDLGLEITLELPSAT